MNIFKNIILKLLRKISLIIYYTVPEEYKAFSEFFETYEYTYKAFNIKGKQTIVQIN